jgi:hypothetical protein
MADRGGRLAPARRPRGFFRSAPSARWPMGYLSEAESDMVLDGDRSMD